MLIFFLIFCKLNILQTVVKKGCVKNKKFKFDDYITFAFLQHSKVIMNLQNATFLNSIYFNSAKSEEIKVIS